MIVTIDGPAGAGKSTVAKGVAQALNMTYLDTGAMYRALTVGALRNNISVTDAEALTRMAANATVTLEATDAGSVVKLDGVDVTSAIRTPEVDAAVSPVSAVAGVREAMTATQRSLGLSGNIVAEGRDMGTVVFPSANVKVFLTATPEARAHRRAVERGVANTDEETKILEAIIARDAYDSGRELAPLAAADDAHVIDSSNMTADEVVAAVVALVKEAGTTGEGVGVSAANAPDAAAAAGAAKAVGGAADGAGSGTSAKRVAPKAAAAKDSSFERSASEDTRLHAFSGNSVDDYYEHSLRDYPLPARALLCVAVNVVWLVTKIIYPWHIAEANRLWEANDDGLGRVIVMNHISMVDPVLTVVALYHHGIRTRPISKSELTKHRFVEWALSRFGCIPVERGTADIKAVRRAQRALKRGEYVLVFPEGTRIKSDDQAIEIHGGFALMAHMAKAAVQPMAIVGARKNPGQVLPHPHRVFLKVGLPITFAALGVKGRKERISEMERVAVERMYELRDELRREHPGRK